MPELTKEAVALHGGCYCSAVRYTINIPPYDERHILRTNEQNHSKCEFRLPTINFDHCNDCRKAAGNVLPIWFICPQEWVTWSVPISKEALPTPNGCAEGDNVITAPSANRVSVASHNFVKRPQVPELESFVTAYSSSPDDTWRTFCTRCGTNLTWVCLTGHGAREKQVPEMDIAYGTLDRESIEMEGMRPHIHSYWGLGIDWVKELVGKGDEM